MTEEIEQIDEAKKAKKKPENKPKPLKARKPGECQCKTPKPKKMEKVIGNTGEFCETCMEVLNWQPVATEKEIEKAKKETEKKQVKLDMISKEFPVIKVLAIKGKVDAMEFVCTNNEKMFSVTVPSTEKKVAKALSDPTIIVGKIAVLEHEGIDHVTGFPINAKVIEVKSKPTKL